MAERARRRTRVPRQQREQREQRERPSPPEGRQSAARQSKRRRRERRDLDRGYLYRFLSMLVILVCVIVALTMFFRVKSVVVYGLHENSPYTPSDVQRAAGVEDGDNMFFLNKYAMASQITRELPYLEEAGIHRELPDTLVIEVTECVTPFAIAQGDSIWLISPGGKIVDRLGTDVAWKYPPVSGCELLSPSVGTWIAFGTEYQRQQNSLIRLLTALREADLLENVDGIRLDDIDCVRMDYAGRFTVKLPYGADYPHKLRELEALLAHEKIQENMTGTFDLTSDDPIHFQQYTR